MPGPHSFRQILSTNGRMPEVLLVPDMKLFAGNATPELAQRIANRLYTSLGDAAVGRFSDGEVSVQINENVRGGDIFIIQSTCAPTNDNLMELVVMVDALRESLIFVSYPFRRCRYAQVCLDRCFLHRHGPGSWRLPIQPHRRYLQP